MTSNNESFLQEKDFDHALRDLGKPLPPGYKEKILKSLDGLAIDPKILEAETQAVLKEQAKAKQRGNTI